MKVSVTVGGSLLNGAAARSGVVETVSAGVRRRLAIELEQELQAVHASERAADPESRRDALERAVRRIWGVAL